MMRLAALIALFWTACAQAETLRLAVTTSFHNSGLSDILLPAIEQDTGIDVQLLVVGTGQALRLGRAGDVDAILVHSKAAEEAFVDEGHGTHRTEIMYNDFVFVGPTQDPADIANADSAAQVMTAIARTQSAFVSRGDDSGTHRKERALWQAAGVTPDDLGAWYLEVGAGMGASLNTAAGLNAYILADRASWLNFANKAELAMLFSGDPSLFNQYSFLPVNPERHPHVKSGAVATLETWLTSQRAAALINGYMIDGQALFVFNAGVTD
ncbi:substrate-binding domain-containing protein [Tateyamaria armeniaca]|uniref:Substrate-binding domain-containing protein n=1 Tax=Tateyamaria armeniaca TaxID=2518930 RepID=A0ABW8UPT8_9RHOB